MASERGYKIIHIAENRLVIARGGGWKVGKSMKGVKRYKLALTK